MGSAGRRSIEEVRERSLESEARSSRKITAKLDEQIDQI